MNRGEQEVRSFKAIKKEKRWPLWLGLEGWTDSNSSRWVHADINTTGVTDKWTNDGQVHKTTVIVRSHCETHTDLQQTHTWHDTLKSCLTVSIVWLYFLIPRVLAYTALYSLEYTTHRLHTVQQVKWTVQTGGSYGDKSLLKWDCQCVVLLFYLTELRLYWRRRVWPIRWKGKHMCEWNHNHMCEWNIKAINL